MACGTVIGTPLSEDDFGITAAEQGLITQSVQVVSKTDKKELKDNCGDVVNLAFYNKTAEVSISGYGSEDDLVVGGALTLANSTDFSTEIPTGAALVVMEVSVTRSNEDFVKSDIKAMAYEGITTL